MSKIKDRVDDEWLFFECPHCKEEIKVPRCRNCIHIEDNLRNYPESECMECDMGHNNYKKKEVIENENRTIYKTRK